MDDRMTDWALRERLAREAIERRRAREELEKTPEYIEQYWANIRKFGKETRAVNRQDKGYRERLFVILNKLQDEEKKMRLLQNAQRLLEEIKQIYYAGQVMDRKSREVA